MEEYNKINKGNFEFYENRIQNDNKSYSSRILLNINDISSYKKNSHKDSFKSEEKTKFKTFKDSKNNRFPLLQISSHFESTNRNKYIDSIYSKNNIDTKKNNFLEKFLFNSLDFDNYQKAVIESKILKKSKNKLPLLNNEEKKDSNKKDEYHDKISSINSYRNNIPKSILEKKKYSNCLKILEEINDNFIFC